MEKKQNQLLRVLKIVGNTIFYIFILILLLFSISNISAKKEDDIPSLFNRGFVNVLTSSMDGEIKDYKVNSFKKDALVFVKILNDEDKANLKKGDVVVFWGQLDPTDPSSKGLIIHRVVDVDKDLKRVQTQGDNKNTNENIYEETSFSGIKAIATSKYEKLGSPIRYMQTSSGFFIFVIIPLMLLVVFEVIVLIRFIIRHNKDKLELKYAEDRERLKEELLKELEDKKKE